MKIKNAVMILSLLLASGLCAPLARADQPATRAEFAAACSKVAKGMYGYEVEHILGKPDDVITQADPIGDDDDPTAEVWCYGTDGHLTFATLGKVWISHGKVREVFGWGGTPPAAAMFAEPELRKLLRAIDATRENNPLRLIQAVNLLQPLGKEKALAALREYRRIWAPPSLLLSNDDPRFAIARILFETPGPLSFTDYLPRAPSDPTLMPLYPFVVVDDIPLQLAHENMMGNGVIPPDPIDYFQKNGTMRQHPLVPGNDPLSVLPALVKSPQWIAPTGKDKSGYERDAGSKLAVANQLLNMIDTVYHAERQRYGYLAMGKRTLDEYWDDTMKAVAALNIHWDAVKQTYVFPDGHTLPEGTPLIYKRQIWELPFAKVPARLIFAREGKDFITITFAFPREVYNSIPDSLVTVRATGKNARQLLQFKIGYSEKRGEIVTHFWNREIDLADGESLQAEVAMGDKTVKSPVLMP